MFRLRERVRLLGLRGRGGGNRGIHLPDVQGHAVRRQLDAAGGGALVLGAYRRFGGGVSVAGAGHFAVDDDAIAGSSDAVALVQVGGLIRSLATLFFVVVVCDYLQLRGRRCRGGCLSTTSPSLKERMRGEIGLCKGVIFFFSYRESLAS